MSRCSIFPAAPPTLRAALNGVRLQLACGVQGGSQGAQACQQARLAFYELMTGMHVVCDVKCSACETVLGWKYEAASEESQQYKIGKFILERGKIAKAAGW